MERLVHTLSGQPPGRATLQLFRRLKYLYFAYFSKPAGDRTIYRTMGRLRAKKILEIGVGSAQRAQRMIRVAALLSPIEHVRYTGVDLFEARTPDSPPGITLKQAHCLLKASGARIQVVPGDPFSALARTANSLPELDLVLIAADQDGESLERAWFYMPRMLAAHTVVLRETIDPETGQSIWTRIERGQIELKAAPVRQRRAA